MVKVSTKNLLVTISFFKKKEYDFQNNDITCKEFLDVDFTQNIRPPIL